MDKLNSQWIEIQTQENKNNNYQEIKEIWEKGSWKNPKKGLGGEEKLTKKWERWTMVQAIPAEQPRRERTRSQEKKRIKM